MTSTSQHRNFEHPYAPDGLYGLMVPYGNFATEWELSVLMPKPSFFITTRLTDNGGDIEKRLREYFDPHRVGKAVDSFGTTPLKAIGVACSSTSYFVGPQKEEEVFDGLKQRYGTSFVRAATAMKEGLDALGARSVALISPYPPAITERCVEYWGKMGFAVSSVCQLENPNPGFHPIYTLTPADVEEAFMQVVQRATFPVLITGTGLSSLPVIQKILTSTQGGGVPILSATLCMARSLLAVGGQAAAQPEDWFTRDAKWLNSPVFESA